MRPLLFEFPLPLLQLPLAIALGLLALAGLLMVAFGRLGGSRNLTFAGAAVAALGVAGAFAAGADRPLSLVSVPVYAHGALLVVAVALGLATAAVVARSDGLDPQQVVHAGAISVAGGLLGARLAYVVENPSAVSRAEEVLAFRSGGLTLWGVALGVLASVYWMRRRRLRVLAIADAAAPGLALALVAGRTGCYLFGCDYGLPLGDRPPAWLARLGTFPRWQEPPWLAGLGSPAWLHHAERLDSGAVASLPVHPTQLYEALFAVLLAVVAFRVRPFRRSHGEVFLLVLLLFLAGRYILEILRDDPERARLGPDLPGAVVLALGAAVTGAGWFFGPARLLSTNVGHRLATAGACMALLGAVAAAVHRAAGAEARALTATQWLVLASMGAVARFWALRLDGLRPQRNAN